MNTTSPNSEFFTEAGKAVAERLYITQSLGRKGLGIERLCNELAELRAKVEALEEAENDRRFEQAKAIIDKPASTPASSLVERVAEAIAHKGCFAPDESYGEEARAAIRAVAAWLLDRGGGYPRAALKLEQEVER